MVFLPTFDAQIFKLFAGNDFHKTLGEAEFGNDRDRKVCCLTPNDVIIGELFLLKFFGILITKSIFPVVKYFCTMSKEFEEQLDVLAKVRFDSRYYVIHSLTPSSPGRQQD